MCDSNNQNTNLDSKNFISEDKERIRIKNPKIKSLFDFLSKAGKRAYRDNYLLSNSIFAKAEIPRIALDYYLLENKIKKISTLTGMKKVFYYFTKSFGWLAVHLMQSLAHRMSGQNFTTDPNKQLIIIDIFLSADQIIKVGDLEDKFFPHLEDRLKFKNKSYAYTPKFTGSKLPTHYYEAFCLLKNKSRPLLSSFQLLMPIDYIKMLTFILVYPFRVFQQIRKLGHSTEDQILSFFLWDTIDHAAVKNYERQLFGRRISKLNVPSVKCISWYENQPQDKNFFKGLRSVSKNISILGAQLYIWPATLLNLHVDQMEIEYDLLPDQILVSGSYFLQEKSLINFKIGPSMRYASLFKKRADAMNKTSVLLLMPFYEYEIEKIFERIHAANITRKIFVKFHPTTNKKKYLKHMKGKMEIVEGDIYVLFQKIGYVIGTATGALVEAASLGIPVIQINTGPGLSHEYMPQLGKGLIWADASSGSQIVEWINKFENSLKTDKNKIWSVAEKYGKMFFYKPTDDRIDKAFEL